MRTKKVTRHYCDHCSRGMFVRKAMERHEASCYSNPQRKCHMCFNRDEYKPVAIENRPKEIIATSNECPHCLMHAVVMYNKANKGWEDAVWYDLEKFKEDRRAWNNENRSYTFSDGGFFAL
jgi:hypothetical protein